MSCNFISSIKNKMKQRKHFDQCRVMNIYLLCYIYFCTKIINIVQNVNEVFYKSVDV